MSIEVVVCAPEHYGTRMWRSVLINDRRAGDVWEKDGVIGFSWPGGSGKGYPSIELATIELVCRNAYAKEDRSYFGLLRYGAISSILSELDLTIHEPVIAMRLGDVAS